MFSISGQVFRGSCRKQRCSGRGQAAVQAGGLGRPSGASVKGSGARCCPLYKGLGDSLNTAGNLMVLWLRDFKFNLCSAVAEICGFPCRNTWLGFSLQKSIFLAGKTGLFSLSRHPPQAFPCIQKSPSSTQSSCGPFLGVPLPACALAS